MSDAGQNGREEDANAKRRKRTARTNGRRRCEQWRTHGVHASPTRHRHRHPPLKRTREGKNGVVRENRMEDRVHMTKLTSRLRRATPRLRRCYHLPSPRHSYKDGKMSALAREEKARQTRHPRAHIGRHRRMCPFLRRRTRADQLRCTVLRRC